MANSPAQRLAHWLATPHGESLLREEKAALGEAARRFHGDTLLWVGCHEATTHTVRGCMVRHRLYASEVPGQAPDELSSFTCELETLPLPNSSVDAMVLHHALETSADPRAGLREAARVLMPGARLVVCAFNPLSLWGLRSAYARLRDDSFTGLRLVATPRLLDWLPLLGFELQSDVKYMAYGLPFSSPRSLEAPVQGRARQLITRLQPPIGGVYLISLVKQAFARRPLTREDRLPSPKLIPAAYPKSTAAGRTVAPVLELRRMRTSGLTLRRDAAPARRPRSELSPPDGEPAGES